jgi:hypothetical protein
MAVRLCDVKRNDSSVADPAKEPLTVLPGSLGFGISNPTFPLLSVEACDPITVAEVLVKVAFPECVASEYIPFQTMVRLMGAFELEKPVQPVPGPVVEPVTFPCWMDSVTPAGRLVTVQLDSLPLKLTVLPPVEDFAGGLNLSLTVGPVQLTLPTASPLNPGPLADAVPTPTSVIKETGNTSANAASKIFLPTLMMSPHGRDDGCNLPLLIAGVG